MGNKLLLTIIICSFFISCQKDDPFQLIYSSPYHKSELKTINDLRVFSSKGEIRNPSIISRFMERDTMRFSMMGDDFIRYQGPMDSITFTDTQNAKVHGYWFSPVNCMVSKQSGHLVLTRSDTVTGYTGHDELSRNIMYYLGQIKPEIFTEFPTSSVRGIYSFGYTAQTKYVLGETAGQLSAPIISFSRYRGPDLYDLQLINNTLQKDFYKNLSPDDTVALRQSVILYEK